MGYRVAPGAAREWVRSGGCSAPRTSARGSAHGTLPPPPGAYPEVDRADERQRWTGDPCPSVSRVAILVDLRTVLSPRLYWPDYAGQRFAILFSRLGNLGVLGVGDRVFRLRPDIVRGFARDLSSVSDTVGALNIKDVLLTGAGACGGTRG